ncbi:copper amine oxidase N-terminal domain-containing protein [Paenibacillus mesophilus]|uniref:copper amine oxidase N-terminal domain-containing protein n=1 Tax=Paenibacillus mesophilus TaxID=2582849 RepID=UPI003B75CF9F
MPAYASDAIPSITVNGVPLITEVQPIITPNGTTMVQFRPLFEKLGLEVGWDQTDKVVTGTRPGLRIELRIENDIASVNGAAKKLEAAPMLVDGVTVVPLRFIGEATGNQVIWNEADRSISINGPIFVKTISTFGKGSFSPVRSVTPEDVAAVNLYEKDGILHFVWMESDPSAKKFVIRLSAADAERWIVTEKSLLELPYYEDDKLNKRPPVLLMEQSVILEDRNGLKQITYNEKGELLSDDYLIKRPATNGEARIIRQVYFGQRQGVIWGPENGRHIYFFDSPGKSIPIKDTPLNSLFLANLYSNLPVILDESGTVATFQGDPFDRSILVRLNIHSGQLERAYPKLPDHNQILGGQLIHRDFKLYLFYITGSVHKTEINLATFDSAKQTITGIYRNIMEGDAFATIVKDEVHFWTISEPTGELNVTVFKLP